MILKNIIKWLLIAIVYIGLLYGWLQAFEYTTILLYGNTSVKMIDLPFPQDLYGIIYILLCFSVLWISVIYITKPILNLFDP